MSDPSPAAARPAPAPPAPLRLIFFIVLLDVLGLGMVLPLLPFFGEALGASPFEVGMLFAAYALAQLVCAPLWGRLSDRLGRRPVLLGALTGSAGAYTLFALSPTYGVLLLARALSGAAAVTYPLAQAWIADVTTPERRAAGMGLLGAAFGLGFVVGPAAGALAGRLGYAAVPALAAILAVLDLGLVFIKLPESLRPAVAARTADAHRRAFRLPTLAPAVGGLMLLIFLVVSAFAAMETNLGLFVERLYGFGFTETAWLFSYLGIVMVVVQGGLLGRLVERFGERRLLATGIAVMATGLALLPLPGALAGLLGATGLLALGMGLYQPTAIALISRLTGGDRQGGTLGIARSVSSLARSIGPLGGGWLFGAVGPAWPFWAAAGLMGAAFGVAIPVLRRARPEPSAFHDTGRAPERSGGRDRGKEG